MIGFIFIDRDSFGFGIEAIIFLKFSFFTSDLGMIIFFFFWVVRRMRGVDFCGE